MRQIAKERRLHHAEAIDELKQQNKHIRKKMIRAFKQQLILSGTSRTNVKMKLK